MPDSGEDCPTCEGRGFLGYDVERDDPRFGEITPCPSCLANPVFQGGECPSEEGGLTLGAAHPGNRAFFADYPSSESWHLSRHPEEEARERNWAQVERDYRAMREPAGRPRPPLSLVPLAEILRPVQVTIQERPRPVIRKVTPPKRPKGISEAFDH